MAKKTTSTRSRSNNTRRTAGGAQQYDREFSEAGSSARTNLRVTAAMQRDFLRMTPAEFRNKYGAGYSESMDRIMAANHARKADFLRDIDSEETQRGARVYDEAERLSSESARETRRRGYAKGGLVKANCGASTKPNRKARK